MPDWFARRLDALGQVGTRLDGRLVLEVPVQTAPVPRAVLDFATEHEIVIRDIAGKVYP